MEFQIINIKMRKKPGRILATADVLFNNKILVHDFNIVRLSNIITVTIPTRKCGEGFCEVVGIEETLFQKVYSEILHRYQRMVEGW